MRSWFFIILTSLWLLICFSPFLYKTEQSENTSHKKQKVFSFSKQKQKFLKNVTLKDKIYQNNIPNIQLEDTQINENLTTPSNIRIINLGTSQQRLTFTWEKIPEDNLSDDSIRYKIYKKVGVGDGDYILISIEKNIAYDHDIQHYSYSDIMENSAHLVSQWKPLRYYSYVMSSMSTLDKTESLPSPAVYGYLVPDIPIDAFKDIWKTLELAHIHNNGFAIVGSSAEYLIGKVSGYFKKTRKLINQNNNSSIPYIYEYNQFAAYHSISVDGILNAVMKSNNPNSDITINGELTITGIYSARLQFVDLVVSAKSGNARSGYFIIEYLNQKQKIPFNSDIVDTLIINNPE